jgi:hypothetical protein
MSDTPHRLLRRFIREEAARIGGLGSRNMATVDPTPITWDKLPGYDVEISPNVDAGYSLTVFHDGKKLGYTIAFNDYDEAMHHARMVVDKHRIT